MIPGVGQTDNMNNCDQLPNLMHGHRACPPFSNMIEVRCYLKNWAYLLKCADCGQLWIVDEWDKFQNLIALKVYHEPNDDEVKAVLDDAHERMAITNAGGLSNNDCTWVGCSNKAINQMKICHYHWRKI